MRIVIESRHQDNSGGGKLSTQLAKCFSQFEDVYIKGDFGNNSKFSGIDYEIKKFNNDFVPDLFIAISHKGGIRPIGKINVHYCFFPLWDGLPGVEDNFKSYDYALCLNEFVDKHQKKNWELPSSIINPYIDLEQYYSLEKKNIILNVGNYFYEKDGHSKNQHILIDWFLENKLEEKYKFIFVGYISDYSYYKRLQDKAYKYVISDLKLIVGKKKNISLLHSINFDELRKLYAESKYLIHAIGYRRNSFHQTEHFGIMALEAMASGCQPIVHNSGGCKDFKNIRTWNEPKEILSQMHEYNTEKLKETALEYSFENTLNQVKKFLDKIKTIPSKKRERLNLGCGPDYKNGWINVDVGDCKKDIEHDLEVLPLPFEDNRFIEISMIHVLEHIEKEKFKDFMRELHRISQPNAMIRIEVPDYTSKNAFTDFNHKNIFTEDSFGYFDNKHYLREVGKVYGIDFTFKILLKVKYNPEKTLVFKLFVEK